MSKTQAELNELSQRANVVIAEYLASDEYLCRPSGSIDLHRVLQRPENNELREATRSLIFVFDRDKQVHIVSDMASFQALARLEQKGPYKLIGGAFAEGEPTFADLLT